MKSIIFTLSLLLPFTLLAQDAQDELNILEQALFPDDQTTVLLYQSIDCPNHQIDSTLRIRASQPDPQRVLAMLRRLGHSKKEDCFDRVEQLYHRHLQNFAKEWAAAYQHNYYACETITGQFSILTGFEYALTSLDFVRKQYTAEQIFQHYQEEMDLNAEMLVNAADRCQLAKRYKVYSSEYRALNPCSFYRGVVPFHYLDPFVQSLAPHFIQVLQDCDWNQQDSVGSSCGLVWASRKFLKRIEAKQISTYFVEHYDNWATHHRAGFLYDYAGVFHHQALAKLLTQHLVTDQRLARAKVDFRSHYLALLLKQDSNYTVVKSTLMSAVKPQLQGGNFLPLLYLQQFPDEEVAVFLLELLEAPNLERKPDELIVGTLQAFLEKSHFSPAVESAIRSCLADVRR